LQLVKSTDTALLLSALDCEVVQTSSSAPGQFVTDTHVAQDHEEHEHAAAENTHAGFQGIFELNCQTQSTPAEITVTAFDSFSGIEPSVGSRGDSYDNALAETINGLCKTELIHRRGPWKTRESVEMATLKWVHWFNHQRLLEPIGYIPPAEAEANYWWQLVENAKRAA